MTVPNHEFAAIDETHRSWTAAPPDRCGICCLPESHPIHTHEGKPPMTNTHRDDLAAALKVDNPDKWDWAELLIEAGKRTHHPVKPPVATPAQLIRQAVLLLDGVKSGFARELNAIADKIEVAEKREARRRAVAAVLANASGPRPSEKLIDAVLEAVLDAD